MPDSGIFFDARYIRFDHHDGISRFSAGLFEALQSRINVTAIIYDRRQLLKLPRDCKYVFANDPTSVKELFVARTLNNLGAKIVFSPMQTMGSWGRKYQLILTLHDLIYYRHPAPPSGFNAFIRLLWRAYHLSYWPQRWLLNRADAVATVSNTTKRLMHQHRLTKRPITVIYNAAGSLASQYEHPQPKMRPREAQKLTYMGSFMDYKNVELLIAAMADLPDYELHLLSKISQQRKAQLLEGAKAHAGRIIFHNGVSEAEYHQILDQSVALVSASRDEGFGIPLVEAMSRGIPVVVSDIQIFREIGGDAALYFDQDSPESFANCVRKLEANPTWLEVSKLSAKRAIEFNWDKSALDLMQLFAQLEARRKL